MYMPMLEKDGSGIDYDETRMREEVEAAMAQWATSFDTVPPSFLTDQRFTALGFQAKGMEFVKAQMRGVVALIMSVSRAVRVPPGVF